MFSLFRKKLNSDGIKCWKGNDLERADLLFTTAASTARDSCCTAYATSLLNLAKVRMQRQHGDPTVQEILSDVVSALDPLKAELEGRELALLSNAHVLRSHFYGISGKPIGASRPCVHLRVPQLTASRRRAEEQRDRP